MRALSWAGFAALVGGSLIAACGGSQDSGLFGSSSGDTASADAGGSSGTSGTSSTSGTSGASGTSGTSGTSGSSGTSGTDGGSSGKPDGGSSGTIDGGQGCRPSVPTDCPVNEYCLVSGCAATGGTCTPKPTVTNNANVVCGCDGVTYFNPTLSAAAGVSVKAAGQCSGPGTVKCQNANCPGNLYCNMATTACATTPAYTCWSMPAACSGGDPMHMKFCPGGGGGNGCLSLCLAVKAEKSYGEDTVTCP